MKGSSWENFQTGRDGIGSLGKNDKRKDSQKVESEKVRFISLEGREIKGQFFKDTQNGKSRETRKGHATKVAGTIWALVPRGVKEGNQ